ncbi:uncharacterized protein TRIADDRAFT_55758 [Trichoplax adhaerens]|uniref:Biogenesis of lysosome-related organelles complex 1 subunit 2 n=1 Tax=Trichoplax adhaerens TaxID=10228 RepID=B3RVS5_TRIAD|nr:hypothetical protein TRIADDRAFT_55758 [Trichoplax adhaerens]EDV25548.1 hypothetical protein TRIADDRAFT_55758 [Trichoplax adhaerens]|eukprot:XP_002111581.1 hypothetical protein TRIADDRAFT_55758 [Trichoplax adhaerens]
MEAKQDPTAPDETNNNLEALCTDMFTKSTKYLQGELNATVGEYELLHDLNDAAVVKYSDMATLVGSLKDTMQDVNEKYVKLLPYLKKIDELEKSIQKLETVAKDLDSYSKRLGMMSMKHL